MYSDNQVKYIPKKDIIFPFMMGIKDVKDKTYFAKEIITNYDNIQNQKESSFTQIDLILKERSKYLTLVEYIKRIWSMETDIQNKKMYVVLMLVKKTNDLV